MKFNTIMKLFKFCFIQEYKNISNTYFPSSYSFSFHMILIFMHLITKILKEPNKYKKDDRCGKNKNIRCLLVSYTYKPKRNHI